MGWRIIGPKFWVARSDSKRSYFYPCVCSCGKKANVQQGVSNPPLGSFGCQSCNNGRRTHGQALSRNKYTPDYRTWANMMSRCYGLRSSRYKQYGGRGIRVCDRWHDASAFLSDIRATIGARPTSKHSLDRINVDGNYEPGNVRWATNLQQSRNRTNNKRIEFNGETLCVSEWTERLGVTTSNLQNRLNRGWPPGKAMTVPFARLPKITISYGDASRSIREWSALTGVREGIIHNRLRAKWTVGQVLGFESKPVRPRGKSIRGLRRQWADSTDADLVRRDFRNH